MQGTAAALEEGGVKCERVLKIQEGRPNASDLLKNGDIAMMLLTTKGEPQPCPDIVLTPCLPDGILCTAVLHTTTCQVRRNVLYATTLCVGVQPQDLTWIMTF